MSKLLSIQVQGIQVNIVNKNYISLTDIAKYKSDKSDQVIQNRMRNRNTIEFLGLWEKLNNRKFNPIEFEGFKKEAGLNVFLMSPKKWIEKMRGISIVYLLYFLQK